MKCEGNLASKQRTVQTKECEDISVVSVCFGPFLYNKHETIATSLLMSL